MHLSTLKKIAENPRYVEHLKYVRLVGASNAQFFSAAMTGGYRLQQVPEEMAAFLTFVEAQPRKLKRYLEIGSASGGFMRCVYERLGFEWATGVDNGEWDADFQEENRAGFAEKVSMLRGDSHSFEAADFLAREPAPFDLICIDGDHSFGGVIKDIDLVLPHAHQDTLIMFHDVHAAEEAPEVGPAMWSAVAMNQLKVVANFFKRDGVYTPLGIAVCKAVF